LKKKGWREKENGGWDSPKESQRIGGGGAHFLLIKVSLNGGGKMNEY